VSGTFLFNQNVERATDDIGKGNEMIKVIEGNVQQIKSSILDKVKKMALFERSFRT